MPQQQARHVTTPTAALWASVILCLLGASCSTGQAENDAASPPQDESMHTDGGARFFLERDGAWVEAASVDFGPLRVVSFRAPATSGGACVEIVVTEDVPAEPHVGIPNCKAAAATVERFATLEQLGSPFRMNGLSVSVGYASESLLGVRVVGVSDAVTTIEKGVWIAAWRETLGPIAIEFLGEERTVVCEFDGDRGATIAELSLCEIEFVGLPYPVNHGVFDR